MHTYISLFSGAGIGCYGFKQEGFECVATNELVPRRLVVQRANCKCRYDSGYVCGDISSDAVKEQIFSQIRLWQEKERLERIDVLIATPPCQGMSVANHKKSSDEIVRNSLVVESIKIIKEIRPKFFILENVPAFMNTICTDVDGAEKTIAEAIRSNLGGSYSYAHKVLNFKDYGACSSRRRTVVIGVAGDYADEVSPLELYPRRVPEKTLRETIGHLRPLREFGEIDPDDIYHSFRIYPEHMRNWISGLREGESAFDNPDDERKPHRIVDGKIVINQRKNGDKYRRQFWDKAGPCVHTRNDQLASQNTIHPSDDRVFSIRELMLMMTVPDCFRWTEDDFGGLNSLPMACKRAFLKKEEIKIRQSLGEAVPTAIFKGIAARIKDVLSRSVPNRAWINRTIKQGGLTDTEALVDFIRKNPYALSSAGLSRIADFSNAKRTDNAAFSTGKSLITEIMKNLPETEKDTVRILEPSVGTGNFLPFLLRAFEGKEIYIDAVDIDSDSIRVAKELLSYCEVPDNCHINFIVDDFLVHHFEQRYDYVIGNPPFYKLKGDDKRLPFYRRNAVNKSTTNICSFFLDKAMELGEHVAFVFPKFLLNTPEFAPSRKYLGSRSVSCIIDFGENGFPGVLVETIAILVDVSAGPSKTRVVSMTQNTDIVQKQKYIFDPSYPCWLIYRNADFDRLGQSLELGVFTVFRDRQITNKLLNESHGIRVIKSRNISDDGKSITDITGYDSFIDESLAESLSVYSFLDRENVYLTPNMTYKPRVIRKPAGTLVNGSVAVLIPRDGHVPTEEQLAFFSSDEYRAYYRIARNYQTRSLNVDNCSVYFYGLRREDGK